MNDTTKRKKLRPRFNNGVRTELHGWTFISIHGSPKERGRDYGKLLTDDMKEVARILAFLIPTDYGVSWDFFVRAAKKYFTPVIRRSFPEFYEEMQGFAEGAGMTIDEVVAWNNYFTLTESWWGNMPEEERREVYGSSSAFSASSASPSASKEGGSGSQERCSAFIAVGKDWTKDGRIVCAHNNFSNFIDGQFAKVVLDIRPTKGNRILMMGFPGWIWSGTDFFITSAGIIGTETTIGGFVGYDPTGLPISCRIRHAMQYGKSLDDMESMLLKRNAGDYANSWLFGNIRTNEIMRLELGLRFHRTERTHNGVFIGFNAAYDPQIRNLECVNSGIDDVRRHQGARKVRLTDLMEKWKGKIDVEVAKRIIADHFDVYLEKNNNPCSRTICSHYELDGREYMSDPSRPKPFQPRGALDGNVVDTAMAERMAFEVRWGSSCGRPFRAADFCSRHRVWKYLEPYLHDRPAQPWTVFTANDLSEKKKYKKRKTRKMRK